MSENQSAERRQRVRAFINGDVKRLRAELVRVYDIIESELAERESAEEGGLAPEEQHLILYMSTAEDGSSTISAGKS